MLMPGALEGHLGAAVIVTGRAPRMSAMARGIIKAAIKQSIQRETDMLSFNSDIRHDVCPAQI